MTEKTATLTLDGTSVEFRPGETIFQIAKRAGTNIPALCNDSRLDPAGACRTCLVEIEGWPRLSPSCAVVATAGMQVTSYNERIDRHRKTLLSLYLTDHPKDRLTVTGAPDQLLELADDVGADPNWPEMDNVRETRGQDRNPYIDFQSHKCILCARCTRYCEEVEGVAAISLAGRGPETTISTVDEISLMDSSCELCGGCIAVCPTGAMTEKMPIAAQAKPERQLQKIRTTCNYCGVGCQLDLNVDIAAKEGRGTVVKVTNPPPGTTTNDGNLCVKGKFAYDFMDHEDRLRVPLIRGEDGKLHEATWEAAIRQAARGLMGVKERYGHRSVGFISSSRCTIEENYLVQKISRAVFHTNSVHQCAAT